MPVHDLRLRLPDGHPLQGGYPVVACATCGTGYADVVVEPAYYNRYYATAAKYAEDHMVCAEPEWVMGRFRATADRIASLVPPGGRVLDIGCANGTLLDVLRTRGFERVQGIDPSPRSAEAARRRGIHVDVGTFGNLPAGVGRFDCICLTGVLEHLWDVDGAVADVVALLAPGGLVYVDVPDASRYADPFIAPFEDFSSEHVNHFSPRTLAALGARWGLETVWSASPMNELVEGQAQPAAVVAWRRRCRGRVPAPDRDDDLVESLVVFTARSREAWEAMDARLHRDLASHDQFVLWGMGELSFKLLAGSALAGRRPVALVDTNRARHGLRFGAVTVGPPPEEVAAPLVIGSLLRADSIIAGVRRAGYPGRPIRLRCS